MNELATTDRLSRAPDGHGIELEEAAWVLVGSSDYWNGYYFFARVTEVTPRSEASDWLGEYEYVLYCLDSDDTWEREWAAGTVMSYSLQEALEDATRNSTEPDVALMSKHFDAHRIHISDLHAAIPDYTGLRAARLGYRVGGTRPYTYTHWETGFWPVHKVPIDGFGCWSETARLVGRDGETYAQFSDTTEPHSKPIIARRVSESGGDDSPAHYWTRVSECTRDDIRDCVEQYLHTPMCAVGVGDIIETDATEAPLVVMSVRVKEHHQPFSGKTRFYTEVFLKSEHLAMQVTRIRGDDHWSVDYLSTGDGNVIFSASPAVLLGGKTPKLNQAIAHQLDGKGKQTGEQRVTISQTLEAAGKTLTSISADVTNSKREMQPAASTRHTPTQVRL